MKKPGVFAALHDRLVASPFDVFARNPALNNGRLDPSRVRELSGVHSLARLGVREITQIDAASLVEPANAVVVARAALESGCRLWVLECSSLTELARLRTNYGDAIAEVGHIDDTHTGNTASVLYALRPGEAALRLLLAFPALAPVFSGIDTAVISRELRETLELVETPLLHRTPVARLLRDPRFYAYLVVFVYSALRALPVTFVKEFEGSLLVLWSIDILTAVPYTWGVLALITGRRIITRLLGGLTTIVTFVTPYVYFWMHGKNYPPIVIVIVAALVLITIGSEGWRYLKERRLERRYAEGAARSATHP